MSITYCEQCGGYTSVTDGNITYQFRPVPPGSTFHLGGNVLVLCPGHPEPAPKHDGKLDEDDRYCVYHRLGRDLKTLFVVIDGSTSAYSNEDMVQMSPKQALSLLVWLRQEESTLEQLVKEQEA